MHIQSSSTQFSTRNISWHQEINITQRNLSPPQNTVINSRPLPSIKQPEAPPTDSDALFQAAVYELKLLLLKSLVENLSGKDIELNNFQSLSSYTESSFQFSIATSGTANDVNDIFFQQTLIQDYQLTQFEISSSLQTESGEQLNISLSVSLESFYFDYQQSISSQPSRQLKDPLVINFDQQAVDLSSTRTTFDIDADGNLDLIPTLASQSAYIALDKNQDGKINDGRELFGAISGNGFKELADYDEDNNGFIDKQDSVFSALLAYKPADNSSQTLSSLGISALSLNHISTPYTLRDNNYDMLGQVRASGFYVKQDGGAGSLQQIDLAV